MVPSSGISSFDWIPSGYCHGYGSSYVLPFILKKVSTLPIHNGAGRYFGPEPEIIERVNNMPLVKITILKGKSPEYRRALMDGVHDALVSAFRIPEGDRNQRLLMLDEDCIDYPVARSPNYTVIEIVAFRGRSAGAKKQLYEAIVRNLGKSPGIHGDDILIILTEPPLENWGIRGGKPADEVDLGFRVNV